MVGHGKEPDFVLGMMAQERAVKVPSEPLRMPGYLWPLSQLGLTRQSSQVQEFPQKAQDVAR